MKELKDIPKENPFKVPEGYFEDLTGRLMDATSGIEPLEEKKPVTRRIRPFIAIAASIALLAATGMAALYFSSSHKSPDASAELNISEININYLNEIDLISLEERVADSDPFDRLPEISRNEIIDYLISENIDILDIYEQL